MSVNNSLAPKQAQKVGFTAYLTNDSVRRQIDAVVGQSSGRFITSIVSAYNANSLLAECDNRSIFAAALLGESLKLSPSPQLAHFYLIPYSDKEKGRVCQFQLGYRGYIQLATRSGVYRKLNVLAIKQGELVKFDPLNEEIEVSIIPDEEARENAPTIGYYAMFEYLNGFRKALYWSKAKMLTHADRYSKAFNKETYKKIQEGKIPANEMWKYSSPWYSSFDDMACKTMLRQLISKWGLMSTDLEKAYTADQGVINDDGSVTYVDNDSTVVESPAPAEPKEEPIMPPPVEAEVVEKPKKAEKKPEPQEDVDAIAAALFK